MVTKLVETTRGGVVESTHMGTVAVVGVDGRLIASAGDPEQFAFFRSSVKPYQAIPVVESGAADRFGFTPAELALCCASHNAQDFHQEQVWAMLRKLGLDDGALQCGVELPYDQGERAKVLRGEKRGTAVQCNCSGKHTGMLAACLQLGFPIESYLEPEHPLQQLILGLVAEGCRVPRASIVLGTDGCSLPTFGTTVRAMAQAFATLASPAEAPAGQGREHAAALDRLRDAMTAHPANVAGTGELDTKLMEVSGGKLVSKSGAEGLLCVGVVGQGIGIAIRVADGAFRAHGETIQRVLEQLDLLDAETRVALRGAIDPRLLNHNKRHVGDIRAAFELSVA